MLYIIFGFAFWFGGRMVQQGHMNFTEVLKVCAPGLKAPFLGLRSLCMGLGGFVLCADQHSKAHLSKMMHSTHKFFGASPGSPSFLNACFTLLVLHSALPVT